MDRSQHQRLDSIRRGQSELDNHLIDEFLGGYISRREFVRKGTVLGLGLPTLGAILAACGSTTSSTGGGALKKGGKMTVAIITPSGAIDPLKVSDEGGLAVLGQAGEYLAFSDKDLKLVPVLAESWQANSDGSVWTFKIRQGVKFNEGTPMTAKDVAFTVNLHADPANGSNARSVFKGVLSKGNTTAPDDTTVKFQLDAPNGNFPYLVSSDNYNLIILPSSYTGGYESSFIGTGPWKKTSFTTGQGVSYVQNPNYWDKSALNLDSLDLKFYADDQPRILALQGGTADVISQFSASVGQALLGNPNITVLALRSSAHRQIHMRTDKEPFTDKNVRQAMGLVLNRQQLVTQLLNGQSDLGNDSPFAPVFPSTDTSVAQRAQDVTQAKQLVTTAGKSGATVRLDTWNGYEIPELAQLVKAGAAQAGINITLNVTDAGTYYGDAVFGKSPWLDSVMGITDYGHRGVPNVFLGAPLLSSGPWNSAHFKNTQYDDLVAKYVAAIDSATQRNLAGQIERLLLDQTPIIFPYFYKHMSASKTTVGSIEPTAMGHISLKTAGFKA